MDSIINSLFTKKLLEKKGIKNLDLIIHFHLFEHPFYYDEKATKLLLNRNGFKIIKKTYFGKKHSVMYVTKKIKIFKEIRYDSYKKNKKIFTYLKNKWSKDLKKIKELIQEDKKVFLFGANIFSQIILSNNIDKKILGIIDNDKNKQNQFLYGTEIKVFSPNILKKVDKPYLYLRAGDYNNEIKKQVRSINKECSFF